MCCCLTAVDSSDRELHSVERWKWWWLVSSAGAALACGCGDERGFPGRSEGGFPHFADCFSEGSESNSSAADSGYSAKSVLLRGLVVAAHFSYLPGSAPT